MQKSSPLLALALLPFSAAPPATDDAPSLERIAELVGSWVVLGADGEPSELTARYELVAGGAAVAETMLAGTEQETLTLYHFEGDGVSATQVSGRGGTWRFEPAYSADDGTMRFAVPEERRAPGAPVAIQLIPLDDERLRVEWGWDGGASGQRFRSFELARTAELEDLAREVARMRLDLDALQRELDLRLKRRVAVSRDGARAVELLETVTLPTGPGWSVSGVPLREFVHEGARFASTFAGEGDAGMTVAHYPFEVGDDGRVTFSVIGGHAYVVLVEETKAPPRKVRSIEDFSTNLLAGDYGSPLMRVSGTRNRDPRAVTWDLAPYAKKRLRLYVVDAARDHYGQIAVSEVRITERAE